MRLRRWHRRLIWGISRRGTESIGPIKQSICGKSKEFGNNGKSAIRSDDVHGKKPFCI